MATALVTIALAALAACGDGDDHGPTPTPAPSATSAPTPTPAPTASPVPTPFTIAAGARAGGGVAVAWGGDRYLVTFGATTDRSAPDVLGVRLTQDGAPVDAQPFALSDFGSDPFLSSDAVYSPGQIASAGTAFGAFFYGSGTIPAGPPGQVVGFVSVPAEGPPALPATAVDEQASFSMAQTSLAAPIAAASNGTSFLAVYQRVLTLVGSFSVTQIVGQIVTVTAGGVRTQEIGPFTGMPANGVIRSGSAPGAATGDPFTAAAWIETEAAEESPGEIATYLGGVLLQPDSSVDFRLGAAQPGSEGVAVAADGRSFLVVWTSTTAADPAALTEVRATRFTAPPELPAPPDFIVAGGSGRKSLGSVAFANGVYLVSWIDDGAVRGARLGTGGDAAEVFTIDPGPASGVALATDGSRFLAVFDRSEGASSAVLGSFVPAD
jgi:hypothetical protein